MIIYSKRVARRSQGRSCSKDPRYKYLYRWIPEPTTMSSNNNHDPPSTARDHFCASLVRAALFPLRVDYGNNRFYHHQHFFPALQALEQLRLVLIQKHPDWGASQLYPKRVVVVKGVGSSGWQWNGQPDIDDDATVSVIPNHNTLSVKCMECPQNIGERLAYLRHQNEIIVCSNNVVKDSRDIPETNAPQTDLPPTPLRMVEEALARELVQFRVMAIHNNNNQTPTCHALAALQLEAAKAAQCYYARSATETRRGSGLGRFTRQSHCVRTVAIRETSRLYSKAESKACVDSVLKQQQQKQPDSTN